MTAETDTASRNAENPSGTSPAAAETAGQSLILVTGPSGAGRSTAIRALEDLGVETIDNLPLSLLPRLLDGPPEGRTLALGIDVRNRDFSVAGLIATVERLADEPDTVCQILYLDCRPDVLVKRYSETRRRHPLGGSVAEGVAREIELLQPIRARADLLIDTSDFTPHDLRKAVSDWFDTAGGQRLAVSVQSFSYKRGVPQGIDIVLDCRFLANPHWEPRLRPLDGRDPEVAAYVAADPRFAPFFEKVADLAEFLLPASVEEGKAHLTIGFGCTGGQHRSVTLAERLAERLAEKGWQVSKRHRELERRGR